ncbi:patatin-like phospholipase family protein [Candidatus Bipolaricaulota bacterium]
METQIGLALGGGGARALAHLGALIALEDAAIPIHCIAGSSMGAAIGAAKAIGADLKKIESILGCLDLNDLLQVSDSTLREVQRILGRGVMEYVRGSTWREEDAKPQELARLSEFFSLLTANKSFDDTNIPFAVVATDVETGERVILDRGKLFHAVTASAAVPGVFSPVAWGGRYLVDGGIVEKLPVKAVIEMGANAILAVDAGAQPGRRAVETRLDALLQTHRTTSQHLTWLQLENARETVEGRMVVLRPDVARITMFGFEHTEEAIQAGKDVVRAHLDQIRALVEA